MWLSTWSEIETISLETYDEIDTYVPEMMDNPVYQVWWERIGWFLDGYYNLYTGQKTLPEIYLYNHEFEEHIIEQQEGEEYVKQNFFNMELVGRLDTRSTFGFMGRLVDGLFKMDEVFENFLSWDLGITGFVHPRIDSFFEGREGPYMPYWLIDLEMDAGYSIGVSKKINFKISDYEKMPVSFGFRTNRLYRATLDSYLTPSTLVGTLFSAGADTPDEMRDALLDEIIDNSAVGIADSMDIGMLVEPPGLPLMVGLVVKDISGTDLYGADVETNPFRLVKNSTVVGSIPQTLNLGASYRTKTGTESKNLLLTMDIRDLGIPDQSMFLKLHFGGEFELVKESLWLRAGINQGYITYGISALINLVILKVYFEASKFEGELFDSRLPGIHTTDPLYTYSLRFSLGIPYQLKMKIKQQNEEDIYF